MATTSRDYYQILGLSKSASADDIKKAFRRLARQVHPDLHSGAKKSEMEKKFKELNAAHEVLSDPDKRKKYDQFGSNWEQAEAYEQARRHAGAVARRLAGRTSSARGIRWCDDTRAVRRGERFQGARHSLANAAATGRGQGRTVSRVAARCRRSARADRKDPSASSYA